MSTKSKQRAKKFAIVLLGVSSVATLGLSVSQGDLFSNDENISNDEAFTGEVKEVLSQSSRIIDEELSKLSAEAVKEQVSIPNDGQYERVRVLATGYTAGPESTGKDPSHPEYGITYSGVYVRRDINSISTIAADPKVFPLGTILYIPGYGYGIVADTGGAIKGKKIDLYYETVEEVYSEWGKKYVDVFVIKRGDGRVTETILNQYIVDQNNRIATINVAS